MDGTGVHLWIYIGQTLIHKIVANWGEQLSLDEKVACAYQSPIEIDWGQNSSGNNRLIFIIEGSRIAFEPDEYLQRIPQANGSLELSS